MNFPTSLRDRRHFFGPTHYSIANYCTETKNEMKPTFGDEYFLDNLHNLIPENLKKNLADTIITEEKMQPKKEFTNIDVKNENNQTENSPLAGITNFLSGVLNVISGAMFSRRKPDFSTDTGGEMALGSAWHAAKSGDENKILQNEKCPNILSDGSSIGDMGECRTAAAHCQNKLEQVRLLLSKPVPCTVQSRVKRRPRKVFVEPGSVEDCFEDAFSPEDFENISNNPYLEYTSPYYYHNEVFHEVAAPEIRIETSPLFDNTDIVNNVPEMSEKTAESVSHDTKAELINSCEDKLSKLKALLQERKKKIVEPEPVIELVTETGPPIERTDIVKNVPEMTEKPVESADNDQKEELISTCENKLSKLKALLQERKKKAIEPAHVIQVVTETSKHIPAIKIKDKHYKNPNRCTDKRRKSKMKQNIDNDMLFANEINNDDLSSVENSPVTRNFDEYIPKTSCLEYFNEISGRFHSTSVTDSEDSFQIVFNDSPRLRRTSDCESEDSFIIFDDSQDSCHGSNTCYTSNDVFGDSSDSDSCDSDSELSDSGCGNLTFRLSHSLSKSVGNLTDDSLYNNASGDEVDCSTVELTVCETVTGNDFNSGLLIDSRKKEIRRSLPPKKVQFSAQPPKVHVMRVWAFAAKQARAGHWERFALDRERFKRRIADVEMVVSWVLRPQHRSRVMFQRFMPWWNAEKRRELAEKKQKELQKKELELQQVRQVAEKTSKRIDPSELLEDQETIKNYVPFSVNNPLQGLSPADSLKTSIVSPSNDSLNPEHMSDISSPLTNVLDGTDGRNKELEDLSVLESEDDNLNRKEVQMVEETVLQDGNLRVDSNTVNIETESIGEVKTNSDATKLQNGEFDNKLHYDGPKDGEFIVEPNEEFQIQESRDMQESKYDQARLLQHKEKQNDKDSDKNTKMIEDCKNNQKIHITKVTNDSKNTLESKNKLVNDFLVNITNDEIRTENGTGTNGVTENKIVPYNDKKNCNDLVTTGMPNIY